MRGEELSRLELLLRFGILVVVGEIGLPEVVQASDSGVAVVDAFRRDKAFAGIYGKSIFSLTSARLSCGICWGMMAYIYWDCLRLK